ncbi:MAG: TonB-dependent receptor plug domain-containing protein, partial [Gemmatimonadetes bacterium]|nr:TonB-dependent receptor plug domain-containing protein [Gemmatimonadota bacterium]
VPLPGLEVEVQRRRARFEQEAGRTIQELAAEELALIPGLAESDPVRAIEVLPGVVSTSDYSAAFNVRGGSADQNLILLDGFPLFNPFHLGGLFSVFNSDLVARAELMAGGFPAEHGGRVSSVLTVESDAGPPGFQAQAGVSLLATRLALGAELPAALARPLGLQTARLRASARRSYFDQLLKPVLEFPYHLTDLQGYFEGWSPGGARLTATAYTGQDVLDLTRVEDFPLRLFWDWGNDLAGIRWTSAAAAGRALDVRAGYSRFSTSLRFPDFEDTRFRSRMEQALLRADLDLPLSRTAALRAGAELDRYRYANLLEGGGSVFRREGQVSLLAGGYLQARARAGRSWIFELGGRADAWFTAGAPTRTALAPRLAVKRLLGGDVAVKLAAGRYTQFLHSLRDEELPLGIDIWVLAGERAPHVVSDQVQAGLERFFGSGWSASIETYYRSFDGVTTNNFAEDPNDRTDDLLAGRGASYGADLLVRRDSGTVRGWLAVSWLRTWREFPDFLSGLDPAPAIRYPPVFDRRLDIDLVLRSRLPWRLDAGLRWNLGTGLPYTRALGSYTFLDYYLVRGGAFATFENPATGEIARAVALGERNGARYPAYHRLDLTLRRRFLPRWGTLTPYLELLNVYNRKNVLFYFYQYDRSPATRSGISMFPLLPTLGLEVVF